MKINIQRIKKLRVLLKLLALFAIPVHAQWIPASLSKPRYALSATSVGSKAFFAGGGDDHAVFKTIDIYDDKTNSWSRDSLSEARIDLAATSAGSKAFFAGGFTATDFSSVVDIYDVNTNTWVRANLTEPRSELSAIALGSKVFFAGGRKSGGLERSDVVNIYDITTQTWSLSHLSEPRCKLSAAVVGNKVFFAGGLRHSRAGISNVVDIYDHSNKTWTVHHLAQKRYDLSAVSMGSKIFFAGGLSDMGATDMVDIYDNSTSTWTTHRLSQARFDLAATSVGSKIFFAGGHSSLTSTTSNVVDIYDNGTNTWTISTLSEARNSLGATSVGTKAIFAGGWDNVFSGPSTVVDIYDTGDSKDTDPPRILLLYKNEGIANPNKIEVEIRITDASRISYVLINNERIDVDMKDSLSFLTNFPSGEEVSVEARDNFNNVKERTFVIKTLPEESSVSSTKQPVRKYYALLMAVQEYSDHEIETLHEPIRDATLLKDVLLKKYTFDEPDITFLMNPTFEDINVAFEVLSTKITPDDLLLIFYAGHGFFDEQTNIGYWLPSDATKKNKSKWFRNSALVENIRAINSQHTLLIADACFSGGIFRTRAPFNNASLDINNMLKRASRKAMTSGSLTTVPDKSIFMKYLLKTLEDNHNLYLPSEDLYDEVRKSMKNNSTIKPAYGEIQNTGDEGGNFVFKQRSH